MANSLVASLGLDTSKFTSGLSEAKSELRSFSDGIKQRVKAVGDFATSLKQSATESLAMARGMSAGELAMKGVTLASKALKVALISTGIGAIVVALGSLVAYLSTTQEGMDLLRQVTEPVAQIFGRLLGVLQELGGSVFKGIALMLKGEIAEGFRLMSEGAKQAGRSTVNAFSDGLKAGSKLAEMTKQIELAENDLILTRSRLNRQIAEAREQAIFLASTDARQAKKFADEAIRLIDERTKAENNLLQMRIDKMKLEHEANDTSRADFKELNTLIAQQEELIATAAKQRQSLNAVIVRANQEQAKSFEEVKMRVDDVAVSMRNVTRVPEFPNVGGLGLQMRDNAYWTARAKEVVDEYNREVSLTQQITGLLSNTFSTVFTAMVTNGQNAFQVLIQGIKALVARLFAAVGTALLLTAILSGLGLGGFSFASFGKNFKSMFGQLSGLGSLFGKDGSVKLAEGGMVTGLTRAVLGDNQSGKEAVIPFEKMGSFLGKYGTNSEGGVYEFILRNEVLYAAVKNAQAKEFRVITG